MIFDKEMERLRMMVQLKHMENFAQMFGPAHVKKVSMAKEALRQMQKLDPHVMTVAMTMVGCEGFIELIDKSDELAAQIAKGELNPGSFMTEMKMLQILELYRAKVGSYVPKPEPYPHDTLLRTDWDGLKHIWHLMNVMETFIRDKQMDKAMRWLGFIQGVLWACRVYDINELKSHNKPDDQDRELLDPNRRVPQPTKAQAEGWVKAVLAPISDAGMIPVGAPVKILAGCPYGYAEKPGVVEQHIGAAYGVRVSHVVRDEKGNNPQETSQVVYAETVERISSK